MSFAIMRTQKLKSAVAVRGSLKHSYREQETPNADESRSNKNVVLVGANNSKEAMQDFRSKLPEKIRKNGVQCVELLITGSNEAMNNKSYDEQMAYFKDSLDWIADKFGGKENIINAGVHFDETTPHMYVYVMPLDDQGKLNCRKFMGGTRDVMSKLQDSFADVVGKKHNLDRGIKGSKAKHQSIAEYYKKINSSLDGVTFTKEDFKAKKLSFWTKENQEGVLQRLNSETYSMRMKALERDDYAKTHEINIQKQIEMQKTIKSKDIIINHLIGGLNLEQRQSLAAQSDQFRQQNYEEEKIKQAEREKRWAEERRQRRELEIMKKGSKRR